MTIREAIDVVISHNAQIAIYETDKKDSHYSVEIWKGMAHSIPNEYLDKEFKPITDYINYDIKTIDHPLHLCLKDEV